MKMKMNKKRKKTILNIEEKITIDVLESFLNVYCFEKIRFFYFLNVICFLFFFCLDGSFCFVLESQFFLECVLLIHYFYFLKFICCCQSSLVKFKNFTIPYVKRNINLHLNIVRGRSKIQCECLIIIAHESLRRDRHEN